MGVQEKALPLILLFPSEDQEGQEAKEKVKIKEDSFPVQKSHPSSSASPSSSFLFFIAIALISGHILHILHILLISGHILQRMVRCLIIKAAIGTIIYKSLCICIKI